MPDKKPAPVTIVDEVVPVKVVAKVSDTVKIAIIAGIVTLGQAFIATRIMKVDNKVQEVHKQINSRMDQLLEKSEQASKAEGKIEEKAEQVTRDSLSNKK